MQRCVYVDTGRKPREEGEKTSRLVPPPTTVWAESLVNSKVLGLSVSGSPYKPQGLSSRVLSTTVVTLRSDRTTLSPKVEEKGVWKWGS